MLKSDLGVRSSLFEFPHYVVLDTNVVIHQIDVLEDNAIQNVIILSTVLNELKRRSPTVYKRLKEICQSKTRGFFVFVNEHHKYVESNPLIITHSNNFCFCFFFINLHNLETLTYIENVESPPMIAMIVPYDLPVTGTMVT